MADNDEIQGLTVKVGVTDELFTQGIGKINKSMNLLRSEFKASAAGLQSFGNDTEKLANKQDFLNRSIELQNGKIKVLKDAYDKSKSATGEFSNATQTAGTKLNNAIAYMAKMQGELKNVDEALEKSKKEVNENSNMWDKLKDKISDATKGIGQSIKNGIGMAIGRDLWDGFKEGSLSILTFGSDSQKAMNQLQASTGYANDSMGTLKQSMLDIYNDNFGENFEDIGESLKIVAQQWQGNSNEIKGLTEDALALRDTFGYDVNESFRAANQLIQQFGVSGDEAYSMIAQGAQRGLDKNGDLLDTINEYSTQFKSSGFSAEDFFHVLQTGNEAGAFSMDKVADSIKEFGLRMKDGSKSTTDALQSLGLNATQTMTKFAKGGTDAQQVFQEVNKRLSNIKDPLQRNQTSVALWATQFEDLQASGGTALANLHGDIEKTTDALNDIKKVKYDDLGQAFEGIKRNLQTGILLPISNEVLPKLSDFSNWFVQHMPQINQSISNSMKQIMPVISSGSKALGDGFNLIVSHMPQIQSVVGSTFQVIGPVLSTGLKLLGDGFTLASKHTDAFKVALIGIGIAFAGFKIGQGIVTSINGIKSAMDAAKIASTGFKIVGTSLKSGFDTARIAGMYLGDSIKTVGSGIGNLATSGFSKLASGAKIGASACADFAKSAATVTIEVAKTTAALIRQGIEWVATKIKLAATTIATGAATIAQNALNLAMSLNPIGIVVIALAGLAAGLVIAYNKSETFRNIVNGAFNAIKETAVNVFNGIKSFLGRWGLDILTFAVPFLGIPLQIIKHWDQIKGFFSDLKNNIKQKLHDMFNFQIPHIKLPHFTVSGSLNPIDWLKSGKPSIGIDWYAKGGIFSSPQVIGVGENPRSPGEAVLPIEKIDGIMASAIKKAGIGNTNTTGDIYITMPVYLDGKQISLYSDKIQGSKLKQGSRGQGIK
ncbi:MAG: minor tail protein [Anaerocolumna sp.]|jgi:phage-related minor tail protein|nr:minor tail protein [Anaerocolumna sp.]